MKIVLAISFIYSIIVIAKESNKKADRDRQNAPEKRKETMFTITANAAYNSIEISFDSKPSEAVREALKSLRFRWHSVKRVWYGYTDEATAREAIEAAAGNAPQKATQKATAAPKKAETVNKYGVKVGDLFRASWGYEQTNNDFFQVVELVGASSVRVREVCPEIVNTKTVSSMSEDRTIKVSREMLPAAPRSVFIKDQERGDLKRLKSYAADGVSNPQFNLSSFADAYYCTPGTDLTVYESWYY